MILSDQLTVRSYSSPEAWKPGLPQVQTEPEQTQPRRSARQIHQPTSLPEPPIPTEQLPRYAALIEERIRGEIATIVSFFFGLYCSLNAVLIGFTPLLAARAPEIRSRIDLSAHGSECKVRIGLSRDEPMER